MILEDLLRRAATTAAGLENQIQELGTQLDRSEVGHWQREVRSMKQRLEQWLERGIPEVVRCEVLKGEPTA